MTRYALTVLLLISSTVLFGQSTLINERQKSGYILINNFQARSILKEHAELIQLRALRRIDSLSYADLTTAYFYKDSALQFMQSAQIESDRIAQSYHEMYVQSDILLISTKKEIRRQKRIKVLTMVGAGVIVLLSL